MDVLKSIGNVGTVEADVRRLEPSSTQSSKEGAVTEGNDHAKQFEVSFNRLQKQLEKIQDTQIQMEYDQEIDRVIVKYVSQKNNEVVTQIPTEKFVAFEKEFVKTVGLLFDMKL